MLGMMVMVLVGLVVVEMLLGAVVVVFIANEWW